MYGAEDQVSLFDQDSWSGKMSPEHSVQTGGQISKPSSKKRFALQIRKLPTFHYLPKESGRWQIPTTEMGGLLPTEFSMHSFGESPSAAVESRLSQILEDTPHPKYFLSAKACQGILRRAERRGKELPPELKTALEYQADHCPEIIRDLEAIWDKYSTGEQDKSQEIFFEGFDGYNSTVTGNVSSTLGVNVGMSTGRNGVICYLSYDARGNGDGMVSCNGTGDHENRVTDYTALVMAAGQAGVEIMKDKLPTLNCDHEQPIVAKPLRARPNDPHREDMATYINSFGFVRRLTPTECERLQGYPDGWTDIGKWTDSNGKQHKESSDSARYKACGNSIALPPWTWVLKRLCACYERPATMGSLFDGIGGFPLIWERLNGPGTCLWASEIEDFCIAVTKRRFGKE